MQKKRRRGEGRYSMQHLRILNEREEEGDGEEKRFACSIFKMSRLSNHKHHSPTSPTGRTHTSVYLGGTEKDKVQPHTSHFTKHYSLSLSQLHQREPSAFERHVKSPSWHQTGHGNHIKHSGELKVYSEQGHDD